MCPPNDPRPHTHLNQFGKLSPETVVNGRHIRHKPLKREIQSLPHHTTKYALNHLFPLFTFGLGIYKLSLYIKYIISIALLIYAMPYQSPFRDNKARCTNTASVDETAHSAKSMLVGAVKRSTRCHRAGRSLDWHSFPEHERTVVVGLIRFAGSIR